MMPSGAAPIQSPGPLARLAIAGGAFLVVIVLVFGDVLIDGDAVLSSTSGDIWRQFTGWYDFGFGQLRQGHLPLWNPHLFSGAPFFAGFQSALLYPPNWIYLALPLRVAINFSIVLHVYLAGLFMYLWAAHRGLHLAAAILAGLVYMFCGAFFVQIYGGHMPHLCEMALAPLIFLSLDDLAQSGSLRGALLGAATVALQVFAGHPQYVFYTFVIASIYAALNAIQAPFRLNALIGFGLSYSGGALLGAVQLLAGAQAVGEATRSKMSLAFASMFPFPPENLLTLIMPGFFGDMTRNPYWGKWFLWEDSVFVGVTALTLAVIGVLRGGSRRRFALTAAAIALVFGLGKYTPVFDLLYHTPGFSSFRALSKFMFLTTMFLALLAGLGFDWLLRARRLPLSVFWVMLAAAALLVIVSLTADSSADSGASGAWGRLMSTIDWKHDGHRYSPLGHYTRFLHDSARQAAAETRWAGLMCLGFAALYWGAHRERRWAYGLLALAGIEAVAFGRAYHSTFSMAAADQRASAMATILAQLGPESRVFSSNEADILRTGGMDVWGDDPMMLRRYVEFFAACEQSSINSLLVEGFSIRPSRLWPLIRCRGFFLYDGNQVQVLALDDVQIPRARLMTRCEVVTGVAEALSRLQMLSFDREHTVLLESPVSPMPDGASDAGQVSLRDISTDEIDVRASVKSPAILLITDAYSNGWHVLPIQSAQPNYIVVPADHALRGIPLAPGEHHFRLVYRPLAFVIGAWVSAVAWLLYAAMLLLFWKRSRRSKSEMTSREPLVHVAGDHR